MLTHDHPALEHLLDISVEFDDPISIPHAPLGTRRILNARTGSFDGTKLSGEVVAGGGDWVLLRQDGVAELDIRLTLRTHEDEFIYLSSKGRFAPPTGITADQELEPDAYYFRTAIFFETGSQTHDELNRILAVGYGTRRPTGMTTQIFEVA